MAQEADIEAQADEVKSEGSSEVAESPETATGDSPAPQRLGDVGQCPVCGSNIAPSAYHCPTCRNSFCFHCRARVLPGDEQLQCVNQQCSYYGKLICDVCEEHVIEEQPPAVYMEPEEGFWPLLLIAHLIAFGFVWSQTSFAWAILFLFLGFPILGLVLQFFGLNIFGRERRVEHRRKTEYYRCICCRQAVKQLSQSTVAKAGRPPHRSRA